MTDIATLAAHISTPIQVAWLVWLVWVVVQVATYRWAQDPALVQALPQRDAESTPAASHHRRRRRRRPARMPEQDVMQDVGVEDAA